MTTSIVARELAKTPRGPSVKFVIDGRPEIRDGRLVVRGALVNEGSRTATVYVASAATGGPFALRPRGGTFKGAPSPQTTPMPEEWVLPAGARVPFESALVLASWELPPDGTEVDWSFQFWTDPVSGTLEGRIAPPKP